MIARDSHAPVGVTWLIQRSGNHRRRKQSPMGIEKAIVLLDCQR
jgi:hypothetical protein